MALTIRGSLNKYRSLRITGFKIHCIAVAAFLGGDTSESDASDATCYLKGAAIGHQRTFCFFDRECGTASLAICAGRQECSLPVQYASLRLLHSRLSLGRVERFSYSRQNRVLKYTPAE